MRGYDHREIEKRTQEKWAASELYVTDLSDKEKEPYYLLTEFPYPSGDLHIGHWYAFAIPDIFARYLRMKGKNVLFPVGFDAFGLPAENAAFKNGADPKEWTYANMDRMRTQLKSMGTSFDWSKEVVTAEPSYYKWTQWLFAKLFEHGLATRKEAPVKWCPKDQTVLANEQVIDGKCERCGTEVEEKRLTQWFMKITEYADRLLSDLDALPWREDIKDAQRTWIGKSEGAKIKFRVKGQELPEAHDSQLSTHDFIEVFTTRPETIFGATYLVIAPEHPLVAQLAGSDLPGAVKNVEEVQKYIEATKKKTERERSENKEKTGIKLEGMVAINPATKEEIPVYVGEYVLGSYGTGALMAVPAHDERDFEFAKKHTIPVRHVVIPRFIDERNPHVPGKELVPRNIIIGIVYDPKTGKYLGLKWKKQSWTTFITGGIDGDEDPVDAARREIHEETGYKNLKYIRTLGGPTQSEFFAAHKDVNRITRATSILFELEDEERDEVGIEELEQHEVAWLDESDVTREKMQHAELDIIRFRLLNEEADYYTEPGILTDSGIFSGRESEEAKWDIVEAVGGERTTQYRMRDWLVSRQRYWGCPIPVVYDPEGRAHLVPAEHLPWLLPTDVDFTPTGKSPLASSKELHERVTKIFGEGWTPEYDTLDTFVDSSWYFLRYLDAKDSHDFSDQGLMKQWLPINRYSGGSEHTTMHLLYARFFHKALYDLALVPTPEPFNERFNRGLIMGTDGQKMSKRWGNVVNPDEMVERYGADAVRVYLAFIGPYNEPGHYPWNLEGVSSMRKFLERIAALSENLSDDSATENILRAFAKTQTKLDADIERFKLNTAVSALMVLVRDLEALSNVPKSACQDLLRFVAPFAPHLAEHLWEQTGGGGSVHMAPWPTFDPSLLIEDTVSVVVQVNGKRRANISVSPDADEAVVVKEARVLPSVETALSGKEPIRVIYVPGKILNLVTKQA
ncbi:MAG: class I tRNA ligase family protein [Minisyncoccia bacterium]